MANKPNVLGSLSRVFVHKVCAECGHEWEGYRQKNIPEDRAYCSGRCRARAYERRKRNEYAEMARKLRDPAPKGIFPSPADCKYPPITQKVFKPWPHGIGLIRPKHRK